MPNAHTITRSKYDRNAVHQEDGLTAALKQTPLWNAFYKKMRRTTRFPRYYRKDLNW